MSQQNQPNPNDPKIPPDQPKPVPPGENSPPDKPSPR